MSTQPLCLTCGTQYAAPRADCPICEDERQYVPPGGQQWTDLATLRADGDLKPRVEEQGPGLIGVGSDPRFAIGQRALLVRAASGNFLWDCSAYLDDELIGRITELGGITGIAISHPHYYTTMVEWAHAFDVPVYLHENDQQWIGRPDPSIQLWTGTTLDVSPDLQLINLGVHFMRRHRNALAGGRGRPRRAADRRHRAGDPGSHARRFHVQLPKPHPGAAKRRTARRGTVGAVRVWRHLRRLVGRHRAYGRP